MEFWIKNDLWELSNNGLLQHSIDDSNKNFENLLKLTYCNTPELLFHLKKRFFNKIIYTYAGQILIAFNPFKNIDIYNDVNPEISHLFNIIQNKNTSFLISGESGAGKTETTKKILQYLSYDNHTVKIIEHFNYFLEAFGNAETQFNKNSSRFGKYIDIKIGKKVSANVSTYLLETCRIADTNLINFHIFNFLNLNNKIPTYFNNDYNNNWKFDYLEINNLNNVWEKYFDINLFYEIINLVKGIYYLLNNNYEDCCILWNINQKELLNVLQFNTLIIAGEKVVKKNNSIKNVSKTISTIIYNKIFDKISYLFNSLINGETEHCTNYGILDIFGFENFQQNYFEQFCINYTNEKLQNIFNKHIFIEEIKLFEDEGILNEKIKFDNNDQLLLNINNIIIKNADDITMIQKNSADFINNIKNNNFVYAKDDKFIINHYACSVHYNSSDFILKNHEKYNLDINYFICNLLSNTKLFANDFKNNVKKNKNKRGSVARDTILYKYKNDLSNLINKIENNNIKFIRCIKPNDNSNPDEWNENKIETQMNYCGIVDAINLTRKIYPVRIPKGLFTKKYDCISYLIQNFNIVYGKNYNFMDFSIKKNIDDILINFKNKNACKIQYFFIMVYHKNKFNKIKLKTIFLQKLFKKWIFKKLILNTFLKKKCCRMIIGMWWRNILKKRIQAKNYINLHIFNYICKKRLINLKNKNKACIKIQKIWRGHYTKILLNMKNYIYDFDNYHLIIYSIKRYFDRKKFISYIKLKYSIETDINNKNHKMIEQLKNKVNFYHNLKNDYYQLQLDFSKYKSDNKDAQEKIGEKMLNLYKENIQLREENIKLINELNKNSWYRFKKIF